jgi:hypothetical protein
LCGTRFIWEKRVLTGKYFPLVANITLRRLEQEGAYEKIINLKTGIDLDWAC